MSDMAKKPQLIQTVVLITTTGKKAVFSGPAQLEEGEQAAEIQITEPKPLPKGCNWEEAE